MGHTHTPTTLLTALDDLRKISNDKEDINKILSLIAYTSTIGLRGPKPKYLIIGDCQNNLIGVRVLQTSGQQDEWSTFAKLANMHLLDFDSHSAIFALTKDYTPSKPKLNKPNSFAFTADVNAGPLSSRLHAQRVIIDVDNALRILKAIAPEDTAGFAKVMNLIASTKIGIKAGRIPVYIVSQSLGKLTSLEVYCDIKDPYDWFDYAKKSGAQVDGVQLVQLDDRPGVIYRFEKQSTASLGLPRDTPVISVPAPFITVGFREVKDDGESLPGLLKLFARIGNGGKDGKAPIVTIYHANGKLKSVNLANLKMTAIDWRKVVRECGFVIIDIGDEDLTIATEYVSGSLLSNWVEVKASRK